jgi:choline kinase
VTLDLVVLAAGRGSRLAALGDDRPKWLLEVDGRTIADRQLEAFGLLRERRGEQVRSLTVVTGHAADAVDAVPLEPWQSLLHNPHYLPRNNWYSVLVALRALPDDDSRVVVVNGDLCAPVPWLLAFLEACADTDEDAMLAIDFARQLTHESMKVSRRGDLDELGTIGKHEFPDPVGEYVGMLMASGPVLKDLRAELEAFEADPASSNEWYEGAVGVSAGKGSRWHLWPTPGSAWVEIDDLADLAAAHEVLGG